MQHRRIGRSGFQWVLAFTLAVVGMGLSHAAELERHVIEIVKDAYSDRFIINGARFSAKAPACVSGWLAGEPVRLLSGEPHGYCTDAVVYNAMRHRACEMWCGGSLFW